MDSKKVGQVVIMVVLLAVLGFSTMYMLKSISGPQQSSPAASVTETAGAAGAATAQANARTAGGRSDVSAEDRTFQDPYLNPNVFRSYELRSPRNPFVQQLEWYDEVLSEELPGWNELRESDYFEQFSPHLPDLEFLREKDFRTASVSRSRPNSYSISGQSEDGQIMTSITLEEDIPTQSSMSWSADSGIPFEMAMNPDFAERASLAQQAPSGGLNIPELPDLFDGPAEALPGPDQLGNGRAGGEMIVCKGVSIEGNRAAALMVVNGVLRLVNRGDILLPPKYKVQEITPDGVVLQDIQDDTTKWVPITGGSPEAYPTS